MIAALNRRWLGAVLSSQEPGLAGVLFALGHGQYLTPRLEAKSVDVSCGGWLVQNDTLTT